ncbi:MAG: phage major capsid protein, partial [Treponema sp.]|nr:phage major capsid protein [Treponema sp.]
MVKYENKELSLQEAIDTRENLIVRARELNEKALSEKRDLTAEEKTSYDRMKADIRTLLDGINAEKRSAELDGFSKAIPLSEPEERNAKRDGMEEFRNYLRTGERRDLIIDGVSQTASALAPKEFVEEIIKSLQKETQLVGRVRTIPLVKAQSIDVPKETAEISDASFTTETGTIAADSQQAFGTVTLGADRVGKLVKVSKKAVLSSAFDVSSLVSEELSYKLRCALENAILNGTGSGQPTGIFATSGA